MWKKKSLKLKPWGNFVKLEQKYNGKMIASPDLIKPQLN